MSWKAVIDQGSLATKMALARRTLCITWGANLNQEIIVGDSPNNRVNNTVEVVTIPTTILPLPIVWAKIVKNTVRHRNSWQSMR
jgi:hypothetical protein